MKAVILAAGEGKRMRPFTYARPKVMLPLANKPIVEHLLEAVHLAGIQEFVFIVGYHDEQVRSYFGNGAKWGVHIEYCNQRRQLGTADALRDVQGMVGDRFLMLNGDIITSEGDVRALLQRGEPAIGARVVEDARALGVLEVEGNRVVAIHEKSPQPVSNLANTGIYFFTDEIFRAIELTPLSIRGEYEITDSIQMLIDSGCPVGYQEIAVWQDASYPWDLLDLNEQILASLTRDIRGEVEEHAVIKGEVVIGEHTIVRSGSYIIGPVIIGENCQIGPNCYIRPSTAIGNNCHIGASVEVKNSIIMNNSNAPHHNYVGDSVIGEGCNLGSGTKIANLRLNKGSITVGGINTKRRKLGALIGDGVSTGVNASIDVGTVIGNRCAIGPGALANGVIAPRSMIV